MINKHYNLLIFFALISSVLLSACATKSTTKQARDWPTLHGKVLEKTKGVDNKLRRTTIEKPIKGAYVAALWQGKTVYQGAEHRVCYHVEMVQTKEDGSFSLSNWQEQKQFKSIKEKSSSIIVYKPGYWRAEIAQNWPANQKVKYYLDKVSGANQQNRSNTRLKYLQKTIGSMGCSLSNEDKSKLRMLYSAVLKEAKNVAQTQEDQAVLRSINNWASFVTK